MKHSNLIILSSKDNQYSLVNDIIVNDGTLNEYMQLKKKDFVFL